MSIYLLVNEIFCPVDWSIRRSCKSSNSPPFFVVAPSFVIVLDGALLQKFYFIILRKKQFKLLGLFGLVVVVGKSGKQSSSSFWVDNAILGLVSEVTLIEPNNSSSSLAADFGSLVLFDRSILF